MLRITTRTPDNLIHYLAWYVGETLNLSDEFCLNITCIQADGHELEYIRYRFPILTPRMRSIVRWYGDIAATIVSNL